MINFILFHRGQTVPDYISNCIKQIQKTQSNYKVYFITDATPLNLLNVEIINLNTIAVPEINNVDYYTNESNPLWRTSFERFFYINQYIKQQNIHNVVHFDNDVLVYYDVNNILAVLKETVNNVALTKHKDNEYVCGFMFIKYSYSLQPICDLLLELAKKGERALESILGSMPHEMRLLGAIQQLAPTSITTLPSLPWSPLFEKFNCIFDPSTYGQYFGFTSHKPKNQVHPCDVSRLIDQHIINKAISPFFDDLVKMPFITYNNKHIPIFNLHIHCKDLKYFS